MRYAFQAESLTKRFGDTVALDGVDLAAPPGSVLAVLGPNGAGKTTAVRILATLLQPDGGRAMVRGLDVTQHPDAVRRYIGLTGQYASVDEDLTGAENLTLFGKLLDMRASDARSHAASLLREFDLDDAADRKVTTYSGGMRRRLDLAASLVGRPDVLFLDEPTTGLDPAKRGDLWQMIRKMADDGITVLLTTQYLEEADALASEISVLDHGRVVGHGTPAELKQIVGGQTITVRPEDPAQRPDAAEVIRAATGRDAESPAKGVLSAPVDGDGAFAETVRRLAAAGISVAELALRLPSLDDVFLTLTGHQADAEDESGAKNEKREKEDVA